MQLAVEAAQPLAQTARDRGVPANTLQTWMGKSHRAERPEPQGPDAHRSEDLQRLRKDHARCKAERAIFKTAAASCAQPLP